MSLLIKALDKAEQGKGSSEKAAASSDLSLELAPLSDDEDIGQSNGSGFSQAASPPGGEVSGSDRKHSGQQAAATVFAARNGQVNSSGSKRQLLIAGGSLLVLVIIGISFYLYLQSLQKPELVMPRPMPAPSAPVAVAPLESQASVATPPDAEAITTAPPAANAVAKLEKLDKPAEAKQDMGTEPSPSRQSRAGKSQSLAFGEPVASNENSTVKITRNGLSSGVNPNLLAAYQAFNAGNDAQAQGLYRQVLQSDVRNVDALLGMAAIALRQGRNNDAAGWYGKVLEVEPRNSIAQAALISTFSQADPVGSETRIKNLLAQQPEAAYLYGALGGLYADQNRWPEAQQAFFQAHHFDAGNPDYLFNLAISLDQMGKSALALQYYKQTLDLITQSGAGGIDRAQLESRISQLQ